MPKNEEELTETEEKEYQSMLKHILKHEGGYTNNKNDRGGETNFGITQKTYEAYQKKQCAKNNLPPPQQYKSVRNISQTEVASIYRSEYYIKSNCHKIKDVNTRFQYFDMVVNHAPKTYGKICQKAVNVPQDGIVGKQTLAAINSGNQIEIQNKMTQYRREHFQEQARKYPKQQGFLKGWLNRVDKVENIMNSGTLLDQQRPKTSFQGQNKNKLGGIDLNINIQSLENIKGVNKFSTKFIQDNKQNIILSDLATVLRVYTDPNIPEAYKNIQFSLDPIIIQNQKEFREQEKVVWPDKNLNKNIIMDTELVRILFECDFLMKLMSLGVSQDGRTPFEYPQELKNRGLKPRYEFISQNSDSQRESLCRYWLVPDSCTYSYQNGKYIIEDIKVICQSRQMERINDKLEDKLCQDPYDGNYQFAQKFTELYDLISQYYPVFKRLKQVFKAVALGKWMYENKINVDHQILFQYLKQQKNYPYKIPIIRYENRGQEIPVYYTYQEKIQIAQDWLYRNGKIQTRSNIDQIVDQLHQKGVQVHSYFVMGGVDPNCKKFIENIPLRNKKISTYDDIMNQSTDDEYDIPFLQTIKCKICSRNVENYLVIAKQTLCSIHHDYTCYICLQLISKEDNYQCLPINGKKELLHSECLVECQKQYYAEDY